MMTLTKYGLAELQKKLEGTSACPTHGKDDNLVICVHCFNVSCHKCSPLFCQCENDE
jgi:hypothetical protein